MAARRVTPESLHSGGETESDAAALGAGTAKEDVVRARPGSLLDIVDRALECLVGERLDLAAVVADQMVMMLAARVARLEPRAPRAGVDPLDEPSLDEQVEQPVDARDADRPAGRA